MQDDPVVRYLVKQTSYRRFWDVMISHYLTPTHSDLNFLTEGCKAGMLARMYPDEKVMASKNFNLAEISLHPAQIISQGMYNST